jgi:class 3 adenylate cyclase/tetratricopeptide (TPR) repeat protein
MDVAAWLSELGLDAYAEAFLDNDIDGETLASLTMDDLKELGVHSLGHRKKLLAAISSLDGKAEVLPSAPRPAAAERAERRQVSVLFADIAGYTALSAELGDERTHALLTAFFERIDQIIVQHGGTIDKHIGDCAMAVFGAPVAHSDDLLRAVRAAVHIHRAMDEVSATIGRRLRAHVGIATGEVIASSTGSSNYREYTVTGETVNLASRLTGLAGDGETMVSDDVVRTLGPVLVARSHGHHAVKGFARPIEVWRLDGLSEDVHPAAGPLVGRRAELAQCLATLETCGEGEGGAVIHIRGEPGIGKTRLMDELLRCAAELGFTTHRVGVFDFGIELERAPLRLLAASLVAAAVGGAAEPAEAVLRSGRLSMPPDYRPVVGELLGLGLETGDRKLLDAMSLQARDAARGEALAWLAGKAAARAPQFVAVEDVHWADSQTVAVLGAIGGASREAPLVLAVTSRIEADPLERIRQAASGARFLSIELAPLAARDARTLARAISSEDNALIESCIERAGGNPLFLEQLIRHATGAGLSAVPGSIQSIVLSRLDRLAPTDRLAAQAASVLGQQFAGEPLRHLLGDGTYEPQALVDARLVRPQGSSWQFAHALIREGVYASLLGAERRGLHRKAAHWFAPRDPVLYAEHLDRAEDEEAPRALLAAAERVGEGYQLERALALAERGAAIARRAEDVCDLQLMRAALLLETGEAAAAAEACRLAQAAAPDDVARARAILGEASALRLIDRVEEALALLDKAQAPLAAAECLAELSRLEHLRGNLLFPRGRIEACLAAHQRALDHARQCGSARHEVRALGGLGDAYYALGRYRTAHEHFGACVEMARTLGLGRVEVANLPMLAITRFLTRSLPDALAVSEEAVAAATAARQPRAEIIARHALLFTHLMAGRPEEAEPQFALVDAVCRRIGARRFESENLAFRGEGLRLRGRRAEAAAVLREALADARATGMDYCGPLVLGYLALALTDDRSARDDALAEGLAMVKAGGLAHNTFFFYHGAIESCLETGEWERAEEFAGLLEEAFAAEPLPLVDLIVRRARLLARAGRGEGGEALGRELEEAITECRTIGCLTFLPALEAAAAAP